MLGTSDDNTQDELISMCIYSCFTDLIKGYVVWERYNLQISIVFMRYVTDLYTMYCIVDLCIIVDIALNVLCSYFTL